MKEKNLQKWIIIILLAILVSIWAINSGILESTTETPAWQVPLPTERD
jgi:hypothetical protein